MPSSCTAYKCTNNSDEGYSLFTYPKDEILKQKWIAAVGRGKDWSPSSSQKLCEIHFLPSEIEFVAKCKRVKLSAVPSRFCTCPSDQKSYRRKLKRKQKHRNGPYDYEAPIGNYNDCYVLHRFILKDKKLADKEKLIEKIRRENDMLRKTISLLQKILQSKK